MTRDSAKVARETADESWKQPWNVSFDARPDEKVAITMNIAGGIDVPLVLGGAVGEFVEDAEVNGRKLEKNATSFDVPECKKACTIRYVFAHGRAATAIGDTDTASRGPGFTWVNGPLLLLHPMHGDPRTNIEIHLSKDIVTPLPSISESEPNVVRVNLLDVERIPYIFFGMGARMVSRDKMTVRAVVPKPFASRPEEMDRWIARSMDIVGSYYGHFPMGPVALGLVPEPGDETRFGLTRPGVGAAIVIYLGEKMKLEDDWVLVHEMIHLGFPTLPREYRWIEEGLATYIEPLAKSRVGVQTEAAAWADLAAHMPLGVVPKGSPSLGGTRHGAWRRMYWGGAIVMMLTDLEIRKRTENKLGLEDALRAVLDAGGNDGEHWTLEQVVQAMERVVPKGWLLEWFKHHHESAATFDLDAIWKRMGVRIDGKNVTFDDRAPEAAFRREISRSRRN